MKIFARGSVVSALLIASWVMVSASSAFAASDCTDFSGNFQLSSDPGEVGLVVTQDKCASINFTYTFTSTGEIIGKTYTLDDVRRQTYEDATLIFYETAGLETSAMTNHVEDFDKASQTTATADTTFTVDSSGNLDAKDTYHDANGQLTQSDDHYYTRVAQ